MTNEEAIEIIKYASAFNNENSRLTKALEKAVEALEKQVPRKPDIVSFDSKNGHFYTTIRECLVCKEIVVDAYLYCDHCGQKLDWSDIE